MSPLYILLAYHHIIINSAKVQELFDTPNLWDLRFFKYNWCEDIFQKQAENTYPFLGILERGPHFLPTCNPSPFEILQYEQALTVKKRKKIMKRRQFEFKWQFSKLLKKWNSMSYRAFHLMIQKKAKRCWKCNTMFVQGEMSMMWFFSIINGPHCKQGNTKFNTKILSQILYHIAIWLRSSISFKLKHAEARVFVFQIYFHDSPERNSLSSLD